MHFYCSHSLRSEAKEKLCKFLKFLYSCSGGSGRTITYTVYSKKKNYPRDLIRVFLHHPAENKSKFLLRLGFMIWKQIQCKHSATNLKKYDNFHLTLSFLWKKLMYKFQFFADFTNFLLISVQCGSLSRYIVGGWKFIVL